MKIVCAWMYAIGQYGFPPAIENVSRALRDMKEMGFDYVEVEGIGYENLDQVVDQRARIRNLCNENDLRISNFAVLLPYVISMDRKVQQRALDYFERGVETARYLESPFVWIDSYFPPLKIEKGVLPTEELVYGQDFRVIVPDEFDWRRFWDNFVTSIIRCNEICKTFQVQFLIEPRVGEVISNTDAMLRLIDLVNDDNFGIILDIAHQHAQKELIPLSIEKLGRHMKYVHVADNDGRDNRHFEPGNGNVDWEEVFRVLKKNRYDSFFAVDLEQLTDLREKFLKSKRFLEGYAKKFGL